MALITLSSSLQNAREILKAMSIVALSEIEGTDLEIGKLTKL